jgi:hypothetical protein
LESSNSGSAVNFAAGTKDVFVTYPAEYAVVASNNFGTSGQVLTSNGANVAATFQAAASGLTGFTAAESTAAPNATVYVDSLTASAASTNADVAFVAKGTGATLAQVPDSTTAGGNKRGTYATDWQKARTASTQVASGNYSGILSGQNNTASNTSSAVVGGASNTASGINSATVGGINCTANSNQAAVLGGSSCIAGASLAAVIGGSSNTASGNSSAVIGGGTNTASGSNSFVGGGSGNLANQSFSAVVGGGTNQAIAQLSSVFGGANGSTRSIQGYTVFPASDGPVDGQVGKQQLSTLLLGRQTTDATATRLTSNTGGAATTNQVILPNNSAYYVKGSVIATVTGGGNTKSWDFIATIKRGANAASTAIVGAVTLNVQAADAGAATWVVAITADTTNGGLAVTVTGQASTTIRWVAKLESTEVTY